MSTEPLGWHGRGYLPHFDSPERVQHVIFRVRDSLPDEVFRALPSNPLRRRIAADLALDKLYGLRPLADPVVAEIVRDVILHFNSVRFDVVAWCIMPNHVHVVAAWRTGFRMGDTIRSWKAYSASRFNRVTATTGSLWARDYFDRFVRDEDDLQRISLIHVRHKNEACF